MELVASYLELKKSKKNGIVDLTKPIFKHTASLAQAGWRMTDGEIETELTVLEAEFQSEAAPMYTIGSPYARSFHRSSNVTIGLRVLADSNEALQLCGRIGAQVTLERVLEPHVMSYTGIILECRHSFAGDGEMVLTIVAARTGRL